MLDVVLEVFNEILNEYALSGFNPCCAGCSSGSCIPCGCVGCCCSVSILVVLDVVLEAYSMRLPYLRLRVSILVVLDVVLEAF